MAQLAHLGLGNRSACSQLGDGPACRKYDVSMSLSFNIIKHAPVRDATAHLSRSLMMAALAASSVVAGVGGGSRIEREKKRDQRFDSAVGKLLL